VQPQTAFERRSDVEIVDVRDLREWDAGHVEGSRHIPAGELPGRSGELRGGVPVVTVCRTGRRSGAAVEVLRSLGVDADHVEGGLTAWSDQGLPLVTAGGGSGVVAPPETEDDDEHGHGDAHHHEHDHDHHGHDHGDDGQGQLGTDVQQRVMELLGAAQEHFGDREPSEEEARAFFRQLLASEGMSPDEIDEILS
jgi:rhodanese-related sulfurtransferase